MVGLEQNPHYRYSRNSPQVEPIRYESRNIPLILVSKNLVLRSTAVLVGAPINVHMYMYCIVHEYRPGMH